MRTANGRIASAPAKLMFMMKLKYLAPLVLIGLLSACGYHLRGSYNIPQDIRQLRLDADAGSALAAPLRANLQMAGITPDDGMYTLTITDESLNKQTTSTDSRAKAAEYTLFYQVRYLIKNAEGQPVSPEHKLLLRRSYQYDTTAIVGKTAEEETLIRELYQDAAQQIVRQLSTFTPQPPAAAP